MRTTEFDNPGKTLGYDIAMMDVPLFRGRYAPSEVRMRYEKPVCRRSERCKGCPYPSDGFVCWHVNDECLRSDMEKIAEKERKHRNERNDQQ